MTLADWSDPQGDAASAFEDSMSAYLSGGLDLLPVVHVSVTSVTQAGSSAKQDIFQYHVNFTVTSPDVGDMATVLEQKVQDTTAARQEFNDLLNTRNLEFDCDVISLVQGDGDDSDNEDSDDDDPGGDSDDDADDVAESRSDSSN